MTAALDLWAELSALGVQVTPLGDGLEVDAPEGVLTAQLEARIARAKAGLLSFAQLEQGLAIREVLGLPAVLLPTLPLATTLVLAFSDGRRPVKWAVHVSAPHADRDLPQWLVLCRGDRAATVGQVLAGIGATLRLVAIHVGEGRA